MNGNFYFDIIKPINFECNTVIHEIIKIINSIRNNPDIFNEEYLKINNIPEYAKYITLIIKDEEYNKLVNSIENINIYGQENNLWFYAKNIVEMIVPNKKINIEAFFNKYLNAYEMKYCVKKCRIEIIKENKRRNLETYIINRDALNTLLYTSKSDIAVIFRIYVNLILNKLVDKRLININELNEDAKKKFVEEIDEINKLNIENKKLRQDNEKNKLIINKYKSELENIKQQFNKFYVEDNDILINYHDFDYFHLLKKFVCKSIYIIIYSDSQLFETTYYGKRIVDKIKNECRKVGIDYKTEYKNNKELFENDYNVAKEKLIKEEAEYYDSLFINTKNFTNYGKDDDSINSILYSYEFPKKDDNNSDKKTNTNEEQNTEYDEEYNDKLNEESAAEYNDDYKNNNELKKKIKRKIDKKLYNILDYNIDINNEVYHNEFYYIAITDKMTFDRKEELSKNNNIVLGDVLLIPKNISRISLTEFKKHLLSLKQKPFKVDCIDYYEISINYIKTYFTYCLKKYIVDKERDNNH